MIRKDYTHNATKKSACHHLADDEEFVRRLVQETLNEVLESEMTEFLGAGKSEPDADASGLPFRILPARSDDEGG